MSDVAQQPDDESENPEDWPDEPIGEGQASIRVLNFSGGGFDSVMQLGVAHALLVNQGKAPDVIVGISSGAIGAAALAEILQAGDVSMENMSNVQYEEALDDRVVRFRQFVDACHGAPEKLLDAILPDAYQIDSFEPLESLQLPRLPPDERIERDKWIDRKSGLVRLYNDLLSIDLPFGAITRLVRRALGFSASSALKSRFKRAIVKGIEATKSWLVVGSQLPRFTPLVLIIGRAFSGTENRVGPTSAGSIIFKFPPIEKFARLWRKYLSFSFLLINWVVISWAFVFLPFLLAHIFTSPPDPDNILTSLIYSHTVLYAIPFVLRFAKAFFIISLVTTWSFVSFPLLLIDFFTSSTDQTGYVIFNFFYALYLIPFFLPLTPAEFAFEKSKFSSAFRDLSKGLFAFAIYLIKWTVVLIPLAGVLLIVSGVLAFLVAIIATISFYLIAIYFPELPFGGPLSTQFFVILFGVFALFVPLGRPIIHLIRAFLSFRRSKKEKISALTWSVRNFLNFYGIGPALAHNYRLKQFLIELFDKNYYGEAQMSTVLNQSLSDKTRPKGDSRLPGTERTLRFYENSVQARGAKIILAIAATDVGSGKLVVLPLSTSVVDGILAATAKTPLFEPVTLKKTLFVDGSEIGHAPTKAIVSLFEKAGLADDTAVHVYPVEPLPISRASGSGSLDQGSGLGPYEPVHGQPYLNLIDIVLRALQLQRFRDAMLERRLTRVINLVIPPGKATVSVEQNGDDRQFFRAFFAPIELEDSPYLNRRIFFSSRLERRVAIAETIADGCRASLEVMLASTLKNIQSDAKVTISKDADGNRFVKCSDVVTEAKRNRDLGRLDLKGVDLPGCGDDGPGLAEICKYCKLKSENRNNKEPIATQSLRVKDIPISDPEIADWPHEFESIKASIQVAATHQKDLSQDVELVEDEAVIACLFSGGVFRGVFQMGVLNALGLVNVKPKIVAGASVGSITAAMVAKALSEPDEKRKTNKILELSSIYLGIDRFILTDRFADFIRNWTIRASEAKFSLKQLDQVFRKYDVTRANEFQLTVRAVLAGLERLFYINPYQINALVSALRNREGERAGELLKDRLQQWLDRMHVGQEVLGAEPIRILIEEFVMPEDSASNTRAGLFNCISEKTVFLATTTNLTQGRLKVLSSTDATEMVTLIEGLLASSAFPGVFRPRRSWDLIPGTNKTDQYIDGGVMDNLPLYSVLMQMRDLADKKIIRHRPTEAPHLMLAASLEVDPKKQVDTDLFKNYWPAMSSRAKELRYNTKLNTFTRVAENLQDIHGLGCSDYDPLKVRVLGIKPRWLCNTFAFHPMLGFRREMQAASIAHGCAATLLAFGGLEEDPNSWHLNKKAIPNVNSFDTALAELKKGKRKDKRDGLCWLNGLRCPYSKKGLEGSSIPEDNENTRYWLNRIHLKCWDRGTHERQN